LEEEEEEGRKEGRKEGRREAGKFKSGFPLREHSQILRLRSRSYWFEKDVLT